VWTNKKEQKPSPHQKRASKEKKEMEEVLEELRRSVENLCSQWFAMTIPQSPLPLCRVVVFGSSRFGLLAGESDDVDLLCIGPSVCKHEQFMQQFPTILQRDPRITHVRVLTTARIPHIAIKLHGKSIDILFASYPTIPADWTQVDDRIVAHQLDDASKQSINGNPIFFLFF
jgi:poly(A) polymerase Pap1